MPRPLVYWETTHTCIIARFALPFNRRGGKEEWALKGSGKKTLSGEGWAWEYLDGGIGVAVSGQHRFGTDAFLLAGFAAPPSRGTGLRPGDRLRHHPLFVAASSLPPGLAGGRGSPGRPGSETGPPVAGPCPGSMGWKSKNKGWNSSKRGLRKTGWRAGLCRCGRT